MKTGKTAKTIESTVVSILCNDNSKNGKLLLQINIITVYTAETCNTKPPLYSGLHSFNGTKAEYSESLFHHVGSSLTQQQATHVHAHYFSCTDTSRFVILQARCV